MSFLLHGYYFFIILLSLYYRLVISAFILFFFLIIAIQGVYLLEIYCYEISSSFVQWLFMHYHGLIVSE